MGGDPFDKPGAFLMPPHPMHAMHEQFFGAPEEPPARPVPTITRYSGHSKVRASRKAGRKARRAGQRRSG